MPPPDMLTHALRHLADLHATVTDLDLTATRVARRTGRPGPAWPPGLADRLDLAELTADLQAVDVLAGTLAHEVLDATGSTPPQTTPARLRYAAGNIRVLADDEHAGLDLWDTVTDHERALTRWVRRATRTVRTGEPCLDVACVGQYVAQLGAEQDDALRCDGCGDVVQRATWERWYALTEWVTVERAAGMLGMSVEAVRQRASRARWDRRAEGRSVRYRAADVLG